MLRIPQAVRRTNNSIFEEVNSIYSYGSAYNKAKAQGFYRHNSKVIGKALMLGKMEQLKEEIDKRRMAGYYYQQHKVVLQEL